MTHTVDLRPIQKTLDIMDPVVRKRIIRAAYSLAFNPRPPGVIKLAGSLDIWRIRVGDYRILYQIEENQLIILIVAVGHRKDIYR